MQRFTDTLPRQGSPMDQLRGHLDAVRTLLKTDQQLWAVLGELVLRAPRDPDLAHIFRQTDQFWQAKLRELIGRAVDERMIAPVLEPADMAALLVVAIKRLGLPTMAGFAPERIDQVFRQFERLLGIPEG